MESILTTLFFICAKSFLLGGTYMMSYKLTNEKCLTISRRRPKKKQLFREEINLLIMYVICNKYTGSQNCL